VDLFDGPVMGVVTNADFLIRVLGSSAFLAGDTTTAFLDEHPGLVAPQVPADELRRILAAAGAAVLEAPVDDRSAASDLDGSALNGWRNVQGVPELVHLRYTDGGEQRTAVVAREWARGGATYWLCADAGDSPVPAQTVAADPRFERVDGLRLDGIVGGVMDDFDEHVRLELDGVRSSFQLTLGLSSGPRRRSDLPPEPRGVIRVDVRSQESALHLDVVEPWAASSHDGGGSGPTTPVPGTVTHVAVAVGDEVEAGAALVVLEAMKMEHTIRADADGTVTEIHVSVGQSVDAHTVVATVEAAS